MSFKRKLEWDSLGTYKSQKRVQRESFADFIRYTKTPDSVAKTLDILHLSNVSEAKWEYLDSEEALLVEKASGQAHSEDSRVLAIASALGKVVSRSGTKTTLDAFPLVSNLPENFLRVLEMMARRQWLELNGWFLMTSVCSDVREFLHSEYFCRNALGLNRILGDCSTSVSPLSAVSYLLAMKSPEQLGLESAQIYRPELEQLRADLLFEQGLLIAKTSTEIRAGPRDLYTVHITTKNLITSVFSIAQKDTSGLGAGGSFSGSIPKPMARRFLLSKMNYLLGRSNTLERILDHLSFRLGNKSFIDIYRRWSRRGLHCIQCRALIPERDHYITQKINKKRHRFCSVLCLVKFHKPPYFLNEHVHPVAKVQLGCGELLIPPSGQY